MSLIPNNFQLLFGFFFQKNKVQARQVLARRESAELNLAGILKLIELLSRINLVKS